MRKWISELLLLALVAALLCGCGASTSAGESADENLFIDAVPLGAVVTKDEALALTGSSAAVPDSLKTVASGVQVKKNGKAVIDYSNIEDGYVMVKYTATTQKRLKAQVKGPTTTYTYNLTAGQWEVFSLSDGNGEYKVTVYENISGSKYSAVVSTGFAVTLKNEFAPFLKSNQYVNYTNETNTLAKAEELLKDTTKTLDKVAKVYNYVVDNLTYDTEKAASVKSGYLPVLDSVLAEKKGICFDYAALMAGMLRSQEVPCKLVVGYAGEAYHAWISVWVEDTGWIDGVVYFDGTTWQRMDPTFASSSNRSASVLKYIGDGNNYTAKYFY